MTEEHIERMDAKEVLSSIEVIMDLPTIERMTAQMLLKKRAKELRILSAFSAALRSFQVQDMVEVSGVMLEVNERGIIRQSRDNFLAVMKTDPMFSKVRYNVLRNAPEVEENGQKRRVSDTDDSIWKTYIEKVYKLDSESKYKDAFRGLLEERSYDPVKDLFETLEWDGTPRVEEFLIRWLKVEDSPYSREVSRLIFAGGVNRLYNPGCKFDDMPVLIGTRQGEGKSTIVQWLAMDDEFYSEAVDFVGQSSIEQLEGAWVCEVSELLALTKAKEQEAVKAYITRQTDKYRKPYDTHTTEIPRRCVFIGTTNKRQFLKDLSGGRRFYPVVVNSVGYDLFKEEAECREYIKQCWAEAKVKYMQGNMPAYANQEYVEQYRVAQSEASEDDWRIGVIEMYLDRKAEGDTVCIKEICDKALSRNPDMPDAFNKADRAEIAQIMDKLDGWERCSTIRTRDYGIQRGWVKTSMFNQDGDLPFTD